MTAVQCMKKTDTLSSKAHFMQAFDQKNIKQKLHGLKAWKLLLFLAKNKFPLGILVVKSFVT